MNILKIAFFSLIFVSSLVAIYFLSIFKKELVEVVAKLDLTSKQNTEQVNVVSGLKKTNIEIESSSANVVMDEKKAQEKITSVEKKIAEIQSEIASVIKTSKREQPEAKTIIDQLSMYDSRRSDITKISRYKKQIKELESDVKNIQSEITSTVALSKNLMNRNKVNEEVIELFQTASVYPNFKAKITKVVPSWEIVLLDAGFDEKNLSPNTKLMVVRDGKKIADLLVSRVAKNKAVASIEKYYTIINELGEEQEIGIVVGDQVLGVLENKEAA